MSELIENFDDEDCWLTPSRNVSTQSEKFDIEAYLADVKLSEHASTLSRKIAKAQQKRALKAKKLEPLTEVAREKSSSPIRDLVKMGAIASTPVRPHLSGRISQVVLGEMEHKMTSTPVTESRSNPGLFVEVSPILSAIESQSLVTKSVITEDDDEDFQDAEDHFDDETMEKISMSASFSKIEALLSKVDDDDYLGQSLSRTPMSQSVKLVKVEEEEIPRAETSIEKSMRSSSVSPRPLMPNPKDMTTPILKQVKGNSEQKEIQQRFARNGMERRSLGSATLLRTARSQSRTPGTVGFSLLAAPNGRQSRSMRTSAKQTPPKVAINATPPNNSTPEILAMKPVLNLHSDLATLDDLTRRQEELLRQEVMQMQQQAERKNSWQGESGSMSSPNSSVTSLASSKSVDIASLNKSLPSQTPSRLRAPSKLPRPTNYFNTNKISNSSNRPSTVEKSRNFANDDECF